MTDPYWRSADGAITLHQGDCRALLAELPPESVSAWRWVTPASAVWPLPRTTAPARRCCGLRAN